MSKEIKVKCKAAKTIPLDDLTILQGNLKELTPENYEKLKGRIIERGFSFPFFVWTEPETLTFEEIHWILDGTHRKLVLSKMKEEGYKIPPLPVAIIEADNIKEAKAKLLEVTSSYAQITEEGLAEFTADLDFDEIVNGIQLPDFDMGAYLENVELEVLEPGCDEDSVPELKDDPITKRGDVWLLGDHRVMCGDSTIINDVEKLLNGQKVHMVFTDPPYNQHCGGGGSFHNGPGRESLKKLDASEDLNNFNPKEFLQVLNSLEIPTNYIFCSKNLLSRYIDNFDSVGRNWNLLIMKKKNPIPQKNNTFLADVEYLFCSRLKGAYWKNNCDFKYYHRVREINVKPSDFGHPTEKQVGYIEPYFEISCPKNGSVVDFFTGSGTTVITCEKTDRKCYGMELDEHYCDIIINRWQDYTGKTATLESTGESYNNLKNNA